MLLRASSPRKDSVARPIAQRCIKEVSEEIESVQGILEELELTHYWGLTPKYSLGDFPKRCLNTLEKVLGSAKPLL